MAHQWQQRTSGSSSAPVAPFAVDVGYVDDTAFIAVSDADCILDLAIAATKIVHCEFLRHAMELNFKPGKTAVLFHFRGKMLPVFENTLRWI